MLTLLLLGVWSLDCQSHPARWLISHTLILAQAVSFFSYGYTGCVKPLSQEVGNFAVHICCNLRVFAACGSGVDRNRVPGRLAGRLRWAASARHKM